MTERSLLLGPPGCGKTFRLIHLVREELQRGTSPERIAFVSFTRKSIEEAVQRAAAAFGLTKKELPYFRTLHSLGFRMLGMRPGEVMKTEDWKDFGNSLGLDITGVSKAQAGDGVIMPFSVGGDRYISIIERAKMRCISLEREFSETADWSLSWPMLRRVDSALKLYKKMYNKFTYVDMIEQFVAAGITPELDLLIIDEAQDLTPLQWQMADLMASRAKRVVIAGDDDQCIHRWAGVDVKLFMQCAENREVLSQSYRLPKPVFELSQSIVRRIGTRFEKQFYPASHEGSVTRVLGPRFFDVSSGSITIMARTNSFANDWARRLKSDGYMFSLNGQNSVRPDTARAIATLRRLSAGERVPHGEVKVLYAELPKQGEGAALKRGASKLLEALAPEDSYDRGYLVQHCGLLAPADEDPMRTLRLGTDMADYMRALERRGEVLLAKPRIKVSTIHAMKGGEDDIVAVDLSSTKACVRSPFQDDEHRTFYVGATRARKALYLIHTDRGFRYVV